MRVKWIVIDKRNRRLGTYRATVFEGSLEGPEWVGLDPGEIGKLLHDHEFGEKDKRHFVKVLGVEV